MKNFSFEMTVKVNETIEKLPRGLQNKIYAYLERNSECFTSGKSGQHTLSILLKSAGKKTGISASIIPQTA